VNASHERIWCGREDRAGLNWLTLWVYPSIPQASECEQLSIIDFEAVRLLCFTFPFPLIESIRWNETPL
jgi:hypothetical protein